MDAIHDPAARGSPGGTTRRGRPVPARCRRRHRPVELPAQPRGAARQCGIRRGEPGDDQDVGGDAAHRNADGGPGAGVLRYHRAARRHRRRRHRCGLRGAALRSPLLHRVAGGRCVGPARRVGEPGPRDPRTRGQEPGGGGAGCRPRPLGVAHRVGSHDQWWPGVRLPGLRVRARTPCRRIRRRRPRHAARDVSGHRGQPGLLLLGQ